MSDTRTARHTAAPRKSRKLLWLTGGILGGTALGGIGAFVQAGRVHIGTSTVPYGSVLSILMFAASALYVAREYQSRWPAIGMAIGWVLGTITLATETATGDLAIAVSNRATIYLVVGSILGGLVASMPPMRRFTPELPETEDE